VEKIVYQRKSRNAGIHTIEIYHPQFYFKQTEMEEYDAQPDRYGPGVIGKYTKGIGQIEGRFPTDDEDPCSFAMTSLHRLLDRMDAKGFNETGKYQPDGVTLPVYDSIGRIDVGSESLIDRSKSIKSHIMDIFEKHGGQNWSNIEGVDQYNACYGGQAAGLCVLSWVESDRWDGRYGVAVATDISEAHHSFMAFAGAASTSTLFFPDAPLPHHSQRATCIMHRFDFFKPVGWHDMSPITDGKYSVEVYLDALDLCHKTLKTKLNGRELLATTDYNVFHTGGGYHIVKKAFERWLRCERNDLKGTERDFYVETRLNPSCHILKIVGPCHTVSSFLNIASVCMSHMEQTLGKVLVVFTFGSGCASSMYQLRFDDLPYFDHFEVWKLRYYRDAIYMSAKDTIIHQAYVDTWMKFNYRPYARKKFGIPITKYEKDVWYLIEIDSFGRRFYHRGGLRAEPVSSEYKLVVDKEEGRTRRQDIDEPVPEEEPEDDGRTQADEGKSLEDIWKEIEYEITYDFEAEKENYQIVGEFPDRYNKDTVTTIIRPGEKMADKHGRTIEPDGLNHSYQIVGTWSDFAEEEMIRNPDASYSLEVVLGENRFEQFYIIQDRDPQKKIYPYAQLGGKKQLTIGPHDGGNGHYWLLDGRDRVTVPDEDNGMPGDKYKITFSWKKLKEVTWEKLNGQTGPVIPGKYYVTGSWADWDPLEMLPDESRGPGWYTLEDMRVCSLGTDFKILRNKSRLQQIYAVRMTGSEPITMNSPISGPDSEFDSCWSIDDSLGTVYSISYFRDPDDCEAAAMKVEWNKIRTGPVVEPVPRYYIISRSNDWGQSGYTEMTCSEDQPNIFTGKVLMLEKSEPFKIVMHKRKDRYIHPDKDQCTQLMAQKVTMDAAGADPPLNWHIGKHPADKSKKGDVFIVSLELSDGNFRVYWSKFKQ